MHREESSTSEYAASVAGGAMEKPFSLSATPSFSSAPATSSTNRLPPPMNYNSSVTVSDLLECQASEILTDVYFSELFTLVAI